MSIYEFAMKMEKDGEQFYRDLAKKATEDGLRKIFNMLADDEVKHYQIFLSMQNENGTEMKDSQILFDAKNVFQIIKQEGKQIQANTDQVALYKKAQEVELQSEKLYRQKAGEINDPGQKSILNRIADEERKHYHLLQNIIEFVNRPQKWIEDAEFNHLDEY